MSYLKHTSLKVISNNSIPKVWNGNMYNSLKISILQIKEEIWNPVHDAFLCREYNLDKWMIYSLIFLCRIGSIGFPENTYFTEQNVSVSGGE